MSDPRNQQGKGAGKGPPPPPPVRRPVADQAPGAGVRPPPSSKGHGKGPADPRVLPERPASPSAAPPADLVAPDHAPRLQHLSGALASATGTLWEGLDPWGRAAPSAGLLEGTVVDFEALRRMWEPLPSPPAPSSTARAPGGRRSALPPGLAQRCEIAVAGARLTPELIERALTEDMDALTPEQAKVLATELAPMAQEAAGHIHIAINRSGEDSLTRADAVLWQLHNIPMGVERSRLLAQRHVLEEEVADADKTADRAMATVDALQSSPAVKSVLQTVLAVRNVLSQRGNAGYGVRTLDRLSSERLSRGTPTTFDPATGAVNPVSLDWIREHNPSVLCLTARMLQATHDHRCRLRFLRMMAVGRLMESDDLRKLTWSYLDDLHASPWDALDTLRGCETDICCRDTADELARQQMQLRRLLAHDLRHLAPALRPGGAFAAQVEDLSARVSGGLARCEHSADRLAAAASALCRLCGDRRAEHGHVAGRFDSAGEALLALRGLGVRLGQEAEADALRRDRQKRAQQPDRIRDGKRGARARAWSPVNTDVMLLHTSDPDTIRRLRGGSEQPSRQDPGSQAGAPQRADVLEDTMQQQATRPYVDLVHGGVEGVYVRDAATCSWGRRMDGQDGTTSAVLNLSPAWTPAS